MKTAAWLGKRGAALRGELMSEESQRQKLQAQKFSSPKQNPTWKRTQKWQSSNNSNVVVRCYADHAEHAHCDGHWMSLRRSTSSAISSYFFEAFLSLCNWGCAVFCSDAAFLVSCKATLMHEEAEASSRVEAGDIYELGSTRSKSFLTRYCPYESWLPYTQHVVAVYSST